MLIRIIFLTFLAGSSAFAAKSYDCRSADGTVATLSFEKGKVIWADETHAASSIAEYKGIESASFGTEKDYLVFKLADFFQTNDSSFYLKIEPSFKRKSAFRAVEGLDNDGHDESVTEFICKDK